MERRLKRELACLHAMSLTQLRLMLVQYLAAHPEELHYSVDNSLGNVLKTVKTCSLEVDSGELHEPYRGVLPNQ